MPWSPVLLDQVRAGVDLVDLIGRYVNLKKAGANWKGLCPFHAEKTPSFMVNPGKGIFHCFGCGVGGDAFGFLMRQDRLTFPEAVRTLARSAGIGLPEERRDPAADSGREELFRALDAAARFYAEQLARPAGQPARGYLERRGIAPEVARRFGLGWAPEAWESLAGTLRAEGVTVETLEAAGLLVRREPGSGHYDRFRGRLMFPIRDLAGRVVAFGGRTLGDDTPKYLNSPETPLYVKGNLLYAADLARAAIRERNRALLVEGYVDCLMAHQHGFAETVAALGTALTPAQLALLRRSCEEVVTFFDADAAGQRAAERAAELLEPQGAGAAWAVNRAGAFGGDTPFRMKVALLPAGHDPDTFLREHGAPALTERIAGARSLLGYALDRALDDPDGATGPRARANGFARAALLLARVTDAQEAAALSREAAQKLGVDPIQLWIEAQKLQAALRRPGPAPAGSPAAPSLTAEHRALVRLLVHHPPARPVLLPLLDAADLTGAAAAVAAAVGRRPDAAAESLLAELDEESRNLLTGLLLEEDAVAADPDAAVADYRRRLEQARQRHRLRALSRSIADTPASPVGLAPALDQLRTLDREGRALRAALGVAQGQHPGPQGPQGVPTHD